VIEIALNKRNRQGENTRDFEAYLPIERGTELWKSLYRKREAVERVISRLKEELTLKSIKVRGLERVEAHIVISLITMLSIALVVIKTGNGNLSTSVNSFRF